MLSMDKQHIVDEIKRTAEENGGQPLGKMRFANETGIKEADWAGVHWVRWSDAVLEAGYESNTMQVAYDDDLLLEKLVDFIRELKRYPVRNELRIRARNNPDFPSDSTLHRLGKRSDIALKTIGYCRDRGGLDDVIEICQPIVAKAKSVDDDDTTTAPETYGYTYLMKSGRYYTIGKSDHTGRRSYDHERKLPKRITIIHTIKSDDPFGVEKYWENRFMDKKTETKGSWYDLNASDIQSFKRWKKIF